MTDNLSPDKKQEPSEIIACAIGELDPGLTIDAQFNAVTAAGIRGQAHLVIERLAEAGYVIAPRVPTPKMIEIGFNNGRSGTVDQSYVAMIEAIGRE